MKLETFLTYATYISNNKLTHPLEYRVARHNVLIFRAIIAMGVKQVRWKCKIKA